MSAERGRAAPVQRATAERLRSASPRQPRGKTLPKTCAVATLMQAAIVVGSAHIAELLTSHEREIGMLCGCSDPCPEWHCRSHACRCGRPHSAAEPARALADSAPLLSTAGAAGASPFTPLGAAEDDAPAVAGPARRGRLGGKQQAAQPSLLRPDELGVFHASCSCPGMFDIPGFVTLAGWSKRTMMRGAAHSCADVTLPCCGLQRRFGASSHQWEAEH